MTTEDSEVLARVSDNLTKLVEIVAGHKARAIRAGFSQPAAEQMALDVHRGLVNVMMRDKKR